MDYPGRIIIKGENNSDTVKAIQAKLNERGFGPLEINGNFDELTESAVRLFQSQSRDSQGIPLVVDGKIGAISWTALFLAGENRPAPEPQKDELLLKVLEIAASQIGVMEDPPGSNRGPQVEKYLASAGCSPGDPWCASFLYWCFSEAAKSMGLKNPLPRTGSCIYHWENTTGKKLSGQQTTDNPALVHPGFIFIMDHGGGKGHTGIVRSVADGYLNTIEGNTNIAGSREGLAVAELKRKINTINAGFIGYSS
jgi:hypothetical protein